MMPAHTAEMSVTPQGASSQDNATLVRRFYDEIFSKGDLAAADELVSPEFVDHIPSPLPGNHPTKGPEAVKWFASLCRDAFPDLEVAIDELLCVDDRVITRVTWSGTQTGRLLGADPTGKWVGVAGIDIARVSNGRLVEHWGQMDVLGMLSQLGYLPGFE